MHTKHLRSDDLVIILVPLSGSPIVRFPGSALRISLEDLVGWGYREWRFQPSEGLPTRDVIDAETILTQFTEVVADYVVVAEPPPESRP